MSVWILTSKRRIRKVLELREQFAISQIEQERAEAAARAKAEAERPLTTEEAQKLVYKHETDRIRIDNLAYEIEKNEKKSRGKNTLRKIKH